MTRPARRIALYGFLGSGNIGNDASFETVLSWLRAATPTPDLLCITIAPESVARRYQVESLPLAFRSSFEGREGVAALVGKLVGRLADVPRSFTMVGRVDAVVVPGMGVLEETLGTRPWGLPLWLVLIGAACRLRARRFILLDIGADWAENPLTRWLHVAATRLATHVSYRDQSSAAVMKRAGACEPSAIAPDLAFAHPARTVAEPVPGRIVVGVMAYYGREDDPVRGADIRRRYVVALAYALTDLVGRGHHIVLVGGDDVDVDVAEEVLSLVRTTRSAVPSDGVVIRKASTFEELIEEMGRAEVVVASRFHNLICALRLARPTVSVGYAGKSRNLMQAVGVDGYCQDIEQLDGPALVGQVQSALHDSEALSERIQRGVSLYAAEVHSLLGQVASEEFGLAALHYATVDVPDKLN